MFYSVLKTIFGNIKSFARAGEEISISYVPFIIGEPLRSHHIQNEWFFNCKCKRCIDPTNNQSFISAIFCKKCQNEGDFKLI